MILVELNLAIKSRALKVHLKTIAKVSLPLGSAKGGSRNRVGKLRGVKIQQWSDSMGAN